MTWEQFKKMVEDKGAKNSDKVYSIDTGFYPEVDEIGVVAIDGEFSIGRGWPT